MESGLTTVIPSRKRTRNVRRMMRLVPWALRSVEEGEVEEYAAAGVRRERILGRPPLDGMGAIRGWIMDRVETDGLVMMDDDFRHVHCLVGEKCRVIADARAIRRILENAYQVAKDLGIGLFGFGRHPSPLTADDADCLDFARPVSCTWGIIGREMEIDRRRAVGGEDIDLVLRHLLKKRIVYVDNRFYFDHGSIFAGAGGLQGVRSEESVRKDDESLRKAWGRYVLINEVGAGRRTRGVASSSRHVIGINVRRKQAV